MSAVPWLGDAGPPPPSPDGISPTVKRLALDHIDALGMLLKQVDLDALLRVYDRLRAARDSEATVYLAGNGGSAAIASHWANDLGKATKRSGRRPMRVMCLGDNVSWLTALANDEGYERSFAGQLENFARPGDLLVLISSSGNSPNLVAAAAAAIARGARVIALVGFTGGALKQQAGECLWVPSETGAYELVEDAHAVLCHILTRCLIQDRPPTVSASRSDRVPPT